VNSTIFTVPNSGTLITATVACNAGDILVGGGYDGSAISSAAIFEGSSVVTSEPDTFVGTQPTAWTVQAVNGSTSSFDVTVYALCAPTPT
jgi:hypothetical protein